MTDKQFCELADEFYQLSADPNLTQEEFADLLDHKINTKIAEIPVRKFALYIEKAMLLYNYIADQEITNAYLEIDSEHDESNFRIFGIPRGWATTVDNRT